MLNAEFGTPPPAVARRLRPHVQFNIQHSAFNIQHSILRGWVAASC
jgi:hypothetical protein